MRISCYLVRIGLGIVRIFSPAFYPRSAFSHPRFILHPPFLIRVLSSIRLFSSVFSHPHPYPPSVSAIRIRIRIRVLSLPVDDCWLTTNNNLQITTKVLIPNKSQLRMDLWPKMSFKPIKHSKICGNIAFSS